MDLSDGYLMQLESTLPAIIWQFHWKLGLLAMLLILTGKKSSLDKTDRWSNTWKSCFSCLNSLGSQGIGTELGSILI